MPCIYEYTNGPRKDTKCGRLAVPGTDLCRRCMIKNNTESRYLDLLDKVQGNCELCSKTCEILKFSKICVKCIKDRKKLKNIKLEKAPSKSKSKKQTGTKMKKCSHIIKKGVRKGEQCTNNTKSDTGVCYKCKNKSGRIQCCNEFTRGPRKGSRCSAMTKDQSGYCFKCRKNKTIKRIIEACENVLMADGVGVVYPRIEFKDIESGKVLCVDGFDATLILNHGNRCGEDVVNKKLDNSLNF